MTGIFDPSSFMDATLVGANATKTVPIPVGEYMGMTKDVESKQWNSKDGTKSGWKLEIPIGLELTSELQEQLGRETAQVRYDCMLEFTDSGTLDMGKGKNVALGRLREAVGLNDPTQPFSPRMLGGRSLRVSVKHRVDGDNIYSEVAAVARISG